MTEHDLKTWPGPFVAVLSGAKRHEVRKADRHFEVGDTLLLREWEPQEEWTSTGHRIMPEPGYDGYTGRLLRAVVTYISHPGTWGLPADLCVMSIEVQR